MAFCFSTQDRPEELDLRELKEWRRAYLFLSFFSFCQVWSVVEQGMSTQDRGSDTAMSEGREAGREWSVRTIVLGKSLRDWI